MMVYKLRELQQRKQEEAEAENNANIDKMRACVERFASKLFNSSFYSLELKEYELLKRQLEQSICIYIHALSTAHIGFSSPENFAFYKQELRKTIDSLNEFKVIIKGQIDKVNSFDPRVQLFEGIPINTPNRLKVISMLTDYSKNLEYRITCCMKTGIYDHFTKEKPNLKEVYKELGKLINQGKNKTKIEKFILAYTNPNHKGRIDFKIEENMKIVKAELSKLK
ncbi:MAG TPA: hypothetical protein VLZ83_05505 [Edaphocola sp.]|nr:hypothetical protein [Edaphocola sp.]